MSKNLSLLAGRKGMEDNLFEKLSASDRSPVQLKALAKEYLMGEANLLGTTSFYDFLKKENDTKKVHVCNGTACLLAGTQEQVKVDLRTQFKPEEIGEICCLGRCHENAAFQLEGKNYSGLTGQDLQEKLVDKNLNGNDSYFKETFSREPVLIRPFPGVSTYYALFEDLFTKPKATILEEIIKSNLRGRGGAGFPLGLKLEACKKSKGTQKFIVCNADEGDPGSYTDRYLLEHQPHSVLFGMLVCGYLVGADTGILYIRAEYPESVRAIQQAIFEFEAWSELHPFNFSFKIIKGAGAYICGEETALLSSIEGQRPEVRIRPPYPTTEGLFGCPTVVNNVETLANLHFILDRGAALYQTLGTPKSKGTKLICLDSFFNHAGVYEVEFGMPLSEIIQQLGNGFKRPVKALHIGGPLGGVVPESKWGDLTLDFESFAQAGFHLGHASILSIPERFPMIKYLEHLFEFTANESCGKCFPCRLGSQRGKEMMQQAHAKKYKIDRVLLDDLLMTLEEGSLCGLGGALPIPIRNILDYFSEELTTYFTKSETV